MALSRRSATATSLAGSTVNTLIVAVQALILVPLYLRAVGPRVYGAWLGSGDVLLWMQAFDLGLPNLMIQRIGLAQGKGDLKSVGEYFATGMLILGLAALAILCVALAVAYWLPAWMGLSGGEARLLTRCFQVGAVAAALILFNNSVVGYSRGVQDTALMNSAMVGSGVAGFLVTLVLLLSGWGLWSIPLGMLARSLIALIGSAFFVAASLRNQMAGRLRFSRPIAKEMAIVSPATTLGGLGYALMNQSESAIVAIFLRPELVPILTLTRKGADVLRGFLDMIGLASYGGFAHLLGSDQRHRALHVHAEITSLRLSLAIAGAAAYMAVNASFVSLWVGKPFYGGPVLTILMAVQMVMVGSSFLMNYLYRACGPVMKGSVALVVECALRVPLMILLLRWLGLPGIPIAGIVTSALAVLIAYRWTVHELSGFAERVSPLSGRVVAVGSAILAGAAWACFTVSKPSWIFVIVVGTTIAVGASAILLYLDPLVRDSRSNIAGLAHRWASVLPSIRG